jgi:hypothetical protein
VNQEGNVFVIEYMTPDGRKGRASLEKTSHTHGPLPDTRDPWWHLTLPEGSLRSEWIGYKGGDGQLWYSKVHAELDYGKQLINLWFEHRGAGNVPHN